ncbi:hypothetical protein GSbR_28050 [Geobacter sp. SVR]|nr:hypothetical protein GSbR_28050 [Geobacter sp. SVR]
MIENVSLSGTLVKLQDLPPGIRPGDTCGLLVCDNPDVPHLMHSCRVIRLDLPHIGLELLELGC